MSGEEEKANTEVFVVSAIGGDDSPQRVHADWLLEGIVDPVFQGHFPDYTVLRADRIGTPGLIDAQIIGKLLTARIVIADLTFLNPNAFYEIGIRHVVNLPIIHVHRSDQTIPFDISLFRSIKYSTERPQHLVAAQVTLKKAVEEVLAEGYKVDNPVTQARGRAQFDQTATPADKILERQMEVLERRLAEVENFRNRMMHGRPLDTRNFEFSRTSAPTRIESTLIFSAKEGTPRHALSQFREGVLREYLGEGVRISRESPDEVELVFPVGAMTDEAIKGLILAAEEVGLWALPF